MPDPSDVALDPQLVAKLLAAGQPGVVPKQPLPANFSSPGDPNPLIRALLDHKPYTDPRTMENPPEGAAIAPPSTETTYPPKIAREALVGAARPILDAGQYLGGTMAGNIEPTGSDAAMHALNVGSQFVGPSSIKSMMLGPFGAAMLRGSTKMHPTVRANLAPELAAKLEGIKDPAYKESAAGALQEIRDAGARGILEMRRMVNNPTDKDLWYGTGWFRGEEGAAKKEIPDIGSKLVQDPHDPDKFHLSHPAGDLNSIYDLPHVEFNRDMKPGNGVYQWDKNTIVVGGDPTNKTHMRKALSATLHETQHAIDEREGFAVGSNPHLELTQPDMYKIPGQTGEPLSAEEAIIRKLFGVKPGNNAFQAYVRSAGETNARNVQGRYAKSFNYLKHPRDTQDLPSGLQIVRSDFPGIPMSQHHGRPAGWTTDVYRGKDTEFPPLKPNQPDTLNEDIANMVKSLKSSPDAMQQIENWLAKPK